MYYVPYAGSYAETRLSFKQTLQTLQAILHYNIHSSCLLFAVARLSKKVVEAESAKSSLERDLEVTRKEFTVVKERHEVVVENNAKLTVGKTPEQLARYVF